MTDELRSLLSQRDEIGSKISDLVGDGGCITDQFIIVRKPGCCPEVKRPGRTTKDAMEFIGALIACRPPGTELLLCRLTWNSELWVEDGYEFMDNWTPPLFIPLRTEWYEAFERGDKDTEYRAYGPRWNEKTCYQGRRATLAKGYGHPRLDRRVIGFKVLPRADAPEAARTIFPKAQQIAAIQLR